MSKLNGEGPENKGKDKGRGLGICSRDKEVSEQFQLGQGMGKRRKAGQN